MEYPLVQLNFTRNGDISNLNGSYDPANKPNVVIETPIFGGVFEVGGLVPLSVEYGSGYTYVNISQNQELTLRHSDGSTFVLTPVETVTIGNRATFLYPLSEKDLVTDAHSLDAEFASLNGVEIFGTGDTLNYAFGDNVNCNLGLAQGFNYPRYIYNRLPSRTRYMYLHFLIIPTTRGGAKTAYFTYTDQNGVKHVDEPASLDSTNYHFSRYGDIAAAVLCLDSPIKGGISVRIERQDGFSYTGYIANPVNVTYSSCQASLVRGILDRLQIEMNYMLNLVKTPSTVVSFTGVGNETITRGKVSYHIVDKDFNAIQSNEANIYGTAIIDAVNKTVKINYAPLLRNNDNRILVEFSESGYEPTLFTIDYGQLQKSMGFNNCENITVKLALRNRLGGGNAVSSVILTDTNGSVNLTGVSNLTPFVNNGAPSLDILAYGRGQTQERFRDLLLTCGSSGRKPSKAEIIGHCYGLPMIAYDYVRLTYDIKDLFAYGAAVGAPRLEWIDAPNNATLLTVLPGLVNWDVNAEKMKTDITNSVKFSATKIDDIAHIGTNINPSGNKDAEDAVKNSFSSFDLRCLSTFM